MPRCVLGLEASHHLAANRCASSVALRWTQSAYGDLRRLYDFLAPVTRAVPLLVNRIERIPAQPRLGEPLPRFVPREVRRVLGAKYEIRYELTNNDVVVLRIFHAREDR